MLQMESLGMNRAAASSKIDADFGRFPKVIFREVQIRLPFTRVAAY